MCRSCGAAIVWARTVKGKAMPVDYEPVDGGNVELTGTDRTPNAEHPSAHYDDRPLAIVHAQPPLDAGPLRMPHHATCPDGATWRTR